MYNVYAWIIFVNTIHTDTQIITNFIAKMELSVYHCGFWVCHEFNFNISTSTNDIANLNDEIINEMLRILT